eukprot:5385103-Lingulodinium_polyedra.AAC.1
MDSRQRTLAQNGIIPKTNNAGQTTGKPHGHITMAKTLAQSAWIYDRQPPCPCELLRLRA